MKMNGKLFNLDISQLFIKTGDFFCCIIRTDIKIINKQYMVILK